MEIIGSLLGLAFLVWVAGVAVTAKKSDDGEAWELNLLWFLPGDK